ncbi:MAG: DNA/RNA nuclease SfsA [Minwuia sp.]|uniref:DNA/RNA nuclease SfsA n=1 Tax=Minwuia sp. TaxID=2493630 RepID=UPI003A87CB2B
MTGGRLLKRYKRFLADVELPDGSMVTAHCPNPGSMLSLIEGEGQSVWLSHSADPKRKLAWSMELIEVRGIPVCVNTQRPNRAAEAAVAAGRIPELAGYETVRREVRYGEGSRIDLLLQSEARPDCYVEIKSVTMSRAPGLMEFPDSVTKRGAKHLEELIRVAETGGRAVLFLLSPRPDGERFRPAADIDPVWAETLKRAVAAGVEAICYTCAVSATGLYPADPIPVSFD